MPYNISRVCTSTCDCTLLFFKVVWSIRWINICRLEEGLDLHLDSGHAVRSHGCRQRGLQGFHQGKALLEVPRSDQFRSKDQGKMFLGMPWGDWLLQGEPCEVGQALFRVHRHDVFRSHPRASYYRRLSGGQRLFSSVDRPFADMDFPGRIHPISTSNRFD